MRRFPLHVALVAVVVLAGCTGVLEEPPERDERAVAALEETAAAVDDAESYRYETDLRIEATGDGRAERLDVRLVGAVDAAAMRMNATTRVDGRAGPNLDGRTFEAYLVNRTTYQQCARPPGFWGVENRTAEDWDTLTPAYRQLSLLESGDLRWEGPATVDGRNATLLVGEPTVEALQQYRDGGTRPVFGGPEFRDVTLSVWVDDGTDLPLKTELRFEVVEGDGSATTRMVTRFLDYGEPVSVEVPAEAMDDPLTHGCPGS